MAASLLTDMPQAVPLQPGQQYQLHPPSATRMKYLAIFLDNVHPLTKIVHAPSIQQLMEDSLSNPSKIGVKGTKNALLFSIYASAVASLTDKECQTIFGVSQPGLLEAFQGATRYALLEASFLNVPDVDLLRAHVLLLVSFFFASLIFFLFLSFFGLRRIRKSNCDRLLWLTTQTIILHGYSWDQLFAWLNHKVCIVTALTWGCRLLKSKCAVDFGGILLLWMHD